MSPTFAAIDFNSWTTYLQAGLAAILAWIVKTLIDQGKDQVKLQTVVEYYIERQTKDAAIRLESVSNPTPPEKQELLRKYRVNTITLDERSVLIDWLREVGTNPDADSAERSAALQILTGIQTAKLFRRRKWLFFGDESESTPR